LCPSCTASVNALDAQPGHVLLRTARRVGNWWRKLMTEAPVPTTATRYASQRIAMVPL